MELSTNALDLFCAINKFEKKNHAFDDEIAIHIVDHQLRMIEKGTCIIYQLYFYVNLFRSLETINDEIINNKKLNKKTIGKLLNKILTLDKEENEKKKKKNRKFCKRKQY